MVVFDGKKSIVGFVALPRCNDMARVDKQSSVGGALGVAAHLFGATTPTSVCANRFGSSVGS